MEREQPLDLERYMCMDVHSHAHTHTCSRTDPSTFEGKQGEQLGSFLVAISAFIFISGLIAIVLEIAIVREVSCAMHENTSSTSIDRCQRPLGSNQLIHSLTHSIKRMAPTT